MFIDEIKIYSRAGHGGKGAVAFQREKYRPKGGPSGGNGGRGGDVILEADHDLNNLIAQYFQPRLVAQDGKQGLGKGMDGPAGKDLVIKVPCGTLIWRLPAPPDADPQPGEKPDDDFIIDLGVKARATIASRIELREARPERPRALAQGWDRDLDAQLGGRIGADRRHNADCEIVDRRKHASRCR